MAMLGIAIFCMYQILRLTNCLNIILDTCRFLLNICSEVWTHVGKPICLIPSLLWNRITPKAGPKYSVVLRQLALMADLKGLEMMSMILLDTGCSQHTFADKSSFSELKMFKPHEMTRSIHGIGGTTLQPIGIGTVTLHVSINGQPHTLRLTNALYCPDLQANLISASQLLDKNVKITLRKHGATVKSASKKVVCEIRHESGLFILSTWQDQQTAMASYSSSNDPIKRLWHERLAHIDPQSLERLQNMSTTLDLKHIPHEDCTCEACVSSAMRDVAHRDNIAKEAKKPYDVVFSDLEGPMSVAGYDGSRYFVTFHDAFSKESEIYLIKYKSEMPAMYRRYKALKERLQEGQVIRRLHADGGGEYMGNNFQYDLKEEGTIFTYSVPASQQQNGAAERLNQTLLNKSKKMMNLSGLPTKYWPLSCLYANYCRNICPTSGNHITPFEIISGREPTYDHIRVFGCKVWSRHGSQEKFKKFVDDKGTAGTFVGFEGTHVVRILTEKGKIIRASAVHFQETRTHPPGGAKRRCLESFNDDDDEDNRPFCTAWFDEDRLSDEKDDPVQITNKAARRSARVKARTHEPHLHVPSKESIRNRDMRRQASIASLAYSTISNTFALLSNKLLADERYEPKNWKSAINHASKDQWLQAARDEHESLLANKTWSLVEPPPDRNVLKGRWVFKYKRGPAGTILRYKARWVVKGYEQQQGIDYADTFASVVKPMSYKALFAIAASLDLEIEQMDVKTAFLYGTLDEEIFVEQPEGLEDGTGRVCRLNKALYGLKQSPRVWYHTLSRFLADSKFHPIDADHSVFSNGSIYIAVYVDDLLIIGKDKTEIQELKDRLSTRFSMSDLGPVAYYLGMAVTRDRSNRILRIGQQSYLEEAIRTAGLWDSAPQLTPMGTERLEPAGEDYNALPLFKAEYQSYVGTLMYAMLGTRPDIAFSVACVSRYASNPTPAHMKAVKRIFSYLHGTLDLRLTFRGDLADLSGYSDSDWGGDPSTFRSTAGFVFNIGSGAISWSSKRQPTVALSTCEAEYRAQTQASKEAIWLRQLLQNLIPLEQTPYATIIYCDNQGAIALAKDPKYHPRTKYIGVEQHWIREKIQNEEVELQYIETKKQVADGLTKPLPKDAFVLFRSALGLE